MDTAHSDTDPWVELNILEFPSVCSGDTVLTSEL